MKKYFYANGQEQHGPLNLEELRQVPIRRDTLIWYDGLENWKPASQLVDLQEILRVLPPPIPIEYDIKDYEGVTDVLYESPTDNQPLENEGMFSNGMSFGGRARRTEYGLSLIIYIIATLIVNLLTVDQPIYILFIWHPMLLYFIWSQGAKRCHDLGHSGWFQFIPFYMFWMLFVEGDRGSNQYGKNPKNQMR